MNVRKVCIVVYAVSVAYMLDLGNHCFNAVNSRIDINEIKECEEDEELGAVNSSRGTCKFG